MTPDEELLVRELQNAGVRIDSVWDLANSTAKYPDALPILVRRLRQVDPPTLDHASLRFADGLVRALTVPKAPPGTASLLIDLMKRVNLEQPAGLPWTIGNALSVVADDSVLDGLVDIATSPRYGIARQGVVLALGRSRSPVAVDVLIGLLHDDDVTGHVLISLRKLKPSGAKEEVEKYLASPRSWIRKEAAKTLKAMQPSA